MAGSIRKMPWSLLVGVAISLAIGPGIPNIAASEEHPVSGEIVVTLLGTGGPEPTATRFGPATLIQAGGLSLLFDAGRGVTVRLYQLGISSGKGIDAVFLTHYHSDHVEGLPDLWMTGYMFGPFGSRSRPLRLWGPSDGKEPSGAARIAKGLTEAFSDDTRIREADEHIATIATQIEARDFQPDRVVFDESGVKVTAFTVDHGDLVKPSVGYRIDYGSRSVTLSGDTKFSENLIKFASGTDLLIHEVFAMSPQLATLPQLKPVADHHSSPEQAGAVFSRVKPKLAAYSHLVLLGVSADEILSRTRGAYQGPVAAGEDLMRFEVGNSIVVKRWNQDLRRYSD
ncbi:MAG TPA: MBL fold metallo-hydrolase [Bradyrhizobium sp.]|uniref:MBL fold metallo-hydrolase n=1 Tax=Bradyrhizobium sp. TaxID=376 RepID=UPI002B484312|nr:MBL fold metallo-hydrolase [Bradyrhizobium sp.]HKO69526.1 MBL fold metallo-hydrolase [Bradyrhizobium sp.]